MKQISHKMILKIGFENQIGFKCGVNEAKEQQQSSCYFERLCWPVGRELLHVFGPHYSILLA